MKKTGKLIVVEGNDGAGKAVQTKLLLSALKQQGPTKYFDFPRYNYFFGQIVGRYLRGEFGPSEQVSPYLISLAYALDRHSAATTIRDFLQKGGYVVTNRYIPSNMAYQTAKFDNNNKRLAFIRWLERLEYNELKLPQEDIVIYLFVPHHVSQTLLGKKGKRQYLKNQALLDDHEKNNDYLLKVEKMYQFFAKHYKHWVRINCVKNQQLLKPEEIHSQILQILKKRKILT